jgi:hypothetical protein
MDVDSWQLIKNQNRGLSGFDEGQMQY